MPSEIIRADQPDPAPPLTPDREAEIRGVYESWMRLGWTVSGDAIRDLFAELDRLRVVLAKAEGERGEAQRKLDKIAKDYDDEMNDMYGAQ